MKICTFFGHRDCPTTVKSKLRGIIIDLIENQGVDLFYIGNQGAFDAMTRNILKEVSHIYPGIQYAVVLAYLPRERTDEDTSDTILPEGMETVPPKFAISKRNEWLLRQASVVVTYVRYSQGGAAKFARMAERQGKQIIAL